jgi:hypothetical protein
LWAMIVPPLIAIVSCSKAIADSIKTVVSVRVPPGVRRDGARFP